MRKVKASRIFILTDVKNKGNGEHLLSRAFADSPLASGFESPEHDAQMVDEYQNRSAAIEKAEEDIEYHQKIINQLVSFIYQLQKKW